MTTATKPEIDLRVFSSLGADLPETPNKSGQYICECPFCEKADHFFVAEQGRKAKWKGDGPFFECKSCGVSGNKYTYLKLIYESMLAKTHKHALTRLSLKRKNFPVAAFSAAKVAYNYFTSRWMIAVKNEKDGYTNIHTYDGHNGSPLLSSPSCQVHLYGLEDLKPEGPVGICEGHWDAISLKYLLSRCQNQSDQWSILAVPGASNFPDSDLKHIKGRDLHLFYDNDEAGHNGMLKAVSELTPHCASIHTIEWPPNRFTDGYDLTDLVRETKIRPDQTFEELLSWCHQHDPSGSPEENIPKLIRTTIEEVIQDFKDTGVYMYPGLRDALVVSLAVVESIRFKGEPLWLYCIGVSGAGKSLILESTLASRECLYRTAITHRSLISGYKTNDGDPSLLAKLPTKSLIVKDYSNVLSLPSYEQDQLFSLLREAYDGRVYRDYGNGVIRQYPPPGSEFEDCRFSFVAGVTPDIYTRDNTALGERFLRFHIPRTGGDDLRAIETAMDDSWRSHQRSRRRAASVAAFLSRLAPPSSSQEERDALPVPTVPQWYHQRLIALAQFVGYCRSHVSRTKDDLDYDPAVESGTRMAKQLKKLSLSIARVIGHSSCDKDVYRLVRKVAWDTAHGKRRQIYKLIRFSKDGGECAWLSRTTGFASSTIYRQLRDMHALGVLKKGPLISHPTGRSSQTYLLSERATEIFDTAKIGEL